MTYKWKTQFSDHIKPRPLSKYYTTRTEEQIDVMMFVICQQFPKIHNDFHQLNIKFQAVS